MSKWLCLSLLLVAPVLGWAQDGHRIGEVPSEEGLFPFNIGKLFSGSVPEVTLKASDDGNGNARTNASVRNMTFAKAMEHPYLFKKPTIFNQWAGHAYGGGEVLYGKNSLMEDIKTAVGNNGDNIIINLNYDADADATDMLRDLSRGVQRYRMAGAI